MDIYRSRIEINLFYLANNIHILKKKIEPSNKIHGCG